MSPSIEAILETIRDLSIKEALVYLIANGVKDFVGEGLGKLKKAIQDKLNESQYAFVPDKNEANYLLNFARDPNYREILMLIPNYRYIDLIRTGLLIDYYHKHHSPANKDRVTQIKLQIAQRPNGRRLLKLADLPTTPFFSVILRYLHKLKVRGYPSHFLEGEFEEFVEMWQKASKMVQTEDTVDDVISFCKRQMERGSKTFFVLGMKTASTTVEDALDELVSKKLLEERNYDFVLTKSEIGNAPRIELMVYSKS